MATGIFKGPKGALIFMGVTMLSVALLVGTEDDEGALVAAADELGRDSSGYEPEDAGRRLQSPAPRSPAPARRFAAPTPDSTIFASDEELLDDASGFDPNPEPLPQLQPEPQFDSSPMSGEGVVVETYEQIEEVR